jgi:hypothetical protein
MPPSNLGPSNLGPGGAQQPSAPPQQHQASQLPTSTAADDGNAAHGSPFAADHGLPALRGDSDSRLRRRSTRSMSHDIEAQRRSSSIPPYSPSAASSSPAGEPGAPAAAGDMKDHPSPLEHHWNKFAILLMVFNFAATGFYFYIRVTGLMWASEGLW